MGTDEVGVKLTVDGEQGFYSVMRNAEGAISDFDRALAKLAQQEKNAKILDQVEKKMKDLTQTEKDAAIAAVKMADETDKAARSASGMGDSGHKAKLSLTDIKSGFDMAINGAREAYQFFKQFIDAASDLNETVSKSRVVFGDMSKSVEDMGNSAASSMGMSKNAAIGAAATYGNLFVSMGLSQQKSAEMSMTMVQLAADFASFNNVGTDVALEKIRAGLVGESEPLKAFGVNINEAALKQEALNLKLWNGKGTLDAATKAQAAYSLILKQSATAQGDFARTADGVANKQRINQARIEDLTASIGKGLLPVWNWMLTGFDKAVQSLNLLITAEERYLDVLDLHHTEMKKVSTSYDEYVNEMQRAAKAAGYVIDAEGNLTKVRANGRGLVTEIIQKNYLWSKTNWEVQKGLQAAEKAAEGARDGTDRLAGSMEDLTEASDGTAESLQDRLSRQLKDLDALIAGEVGKTIESFNTKMGDLRKTGYDLETQIAELEKLKYFTPEQKEKLADLRNKLDENRSKMKAVADEFELSAKRMLFAMIEQKVASDGLTNMEVDNLTTLGEAWGLIDPATAKAAKAINGLDLSKGKLTLSDLNYILGLVTGNSYTSAGAVIDAAARMNTIQLGVARGELAPMDQIYRDVQTNSILASQKAAEATAKMNEIQLGVARGELAPIDQLLRSIMGQPSTKTVDVTTNYYENHYTSTKKTGEHGADSEYASGGMFTIPEAYGYEGFNLGGIASASGGETVAIFPRGMADMFDRSVRSLLGVVSALSAMPQTQVNDRRQRNYNLSVMTNQSPAVVQQSFEMMRMLAGG